MILSIVWKKKQQQMSVDEIMAEIKKLSHFNFEFLQFLQLVWTPRTQHYRVRASAEVPEPAVPLPIPTRNLHPPPRHLPDSTNERSVVLAGLRK